MTHRKEGQEKAQGPIVTGFSRLPIFRVCGGSDASRGEFVRRLMTELPARALTGFFLRRSDGNTPYTLTLLARRYDLVLVNSDVEAADQPITLVAYAERDNGESPWLVSEAEGLPSLLSRFLEKLSECCLRTPVWACVLIGGKSSRMGRPKHLIKDKEGRTWLENTIATLRPLVDGIVVSGGGVLPESLADTLRLPDIPGVSGPLTGILAAGRWQPLVSWLLVACDMPQVSAEAVTWLLADRRPGCWGRVPKFAGNKRLEPLLAWYDFRSMLLFEEQLYTRNLRIGESAGDSRIDHPVISEELCRSWENINTPEQLQKVQER
ncbi:MAG: molybdenum cofactor guanylyltransferase [Desulforhopalus sp.]|nr:molybdenum cofactor guanylyltransferase [Desulforhopalus sp.]